MSSRSLIASQSGIAAIQNKLTAKKWSHDDLAETADMSRGTAINFCTGKKVDRKNFVTCCEKLDLDWEMISGQEEVVSLPAETPIDIDSLVKQLRESSAESLRQRCGTMRILDMTQPIDSGAIYTAVNILERVAGKTRREIQEMMADCGAEGFDRFFLGKVKEKRVEGLKAVLDRQHLMILGQPGAGKTTFLKRLAIECLNGTFLADRLPIFVTLKEFSETKGSPEIVDFMGNDQTTLTQILESGKALVLLDGLDEVMKQEHDRVIHEIRGFSEKYNKNHIVITCRIAAREYIFQQFTEVEMADFDDGQIQTFADKWFKTKENNPVSTTSELFWQELEAREPVKELAANPLLLTLLCLEFDNSSAFPKSRSDLYKRSLDILLSKWDTQRSIKREEIYKDLSLPRKKTLLRQLAMETFDREEYFFKERVATQLIERYIRNLPGAHDDLGALEVDSLAVLKSIESQHGILSERATGIYSFSHLTFHEYFTAKNILESANPEQALNRLIEHIFDGRWREVFLIIVEQLDDASSFLKQMKQRIDSILATDQKLQRFLERANQKSNLADVPYKGAAMRAYYAYLAWPLGNSNTAHNKRLDRALADQKNRDFETDSDLIIYVNLARTIDSTLDSDLAIFAGTKCLLSPAALKRLLVIDLTLGFKDASSDVVCQFQLLNDSIPNLDDEQQIEAWWDKGFEQWRYDLRLVMYDNGRHSYDWPFESKQAEKIRCYYIANLLLTDCLNSECYVSREVREELEATMLLPMAEIEKWKAERMQN